MASSYEADELCNFGWWISKEPEKRAKPAKLGKFEKSLRLKNVKNIILKFVFINLVVVLVGF